MIPTGFEPTIPASERIQIYALNRAAVAIRNECVCVCVLYSTNRINKIVCVICSINRRNTIQTSGEKCQRIFDITVE